MSIEVVIDYDEATNNSNCNVQEDRKDMTMEQLKFLEEIATPSAFEAISKWTETIGLCTYSFLEVLEGTVCDVRMIKRIVYNEKDDVLFCESENQSFKVVMGFNPQMKPKAYMDLSTTDKLSQVEDYYRYNIEVPNDERPYRVWLLSHKRIGEKSYIHCGMTTGQFIVKNEEYTYWLNFNNDRILKNPVLMDALMTSLFSLKIEIAEEILQYLVTKFRISETEFEEMGYVGVRVEKYRHTISTLRYDKGKVAQVVFEADNGQYEMFSDGTWHFVSPDIDIRFTGTRTEIWHPTGRYGDPYEGYLNTCLETVKVKTEEYFNTPRITFPKV